MLRARAVMLTNYDEVARFVGLDPAPMLKRAGINPSDLRDPEQWLPARKLLALIDSSADRSGRDDFGILLGKCRTFTSLGPVALLLKHEATLREIIAAGMEYSYLLNDLLQMEVRDDGESATVEWNFSPGVRSRHGANLIAAMITEAFPKPWSAAGSPTASISGIRRPNISQRSSAISNAASSSTATLTACRAHRPLSTRPIFSPMRIWLLTRGDC